MAVDIKINSEFDVQLDHRNDLPLVEGREAFEQHLAVSVTKYFHELIGTTDTNLAEKIELQARRVVDRVADIDDVAAVTAESKEGEPNTVEVTVLYDTGEETTFDIQ